MAGSFFGDLIQRLTRLGGEFLPHRLITSGAGARSIETWCNTLLTSVGEASGTAIASSILRFWHGLDERGRGEFLTMLETRFGVDHGRLGDAARSYQDTPSELAAAELQRAAEARRQDLFRRLNLAPGGTATLVQMREDLLNRQSKDPDRYAAVDLDFVHLFSSWFNRGFLTLQRIDWGTSARILEKVIRYEAVHEIQGWDDLKRRLEPEDRRCYAFFHPALPDEPLIFVEVALTNDVPSAIAPLLAEDRSPVAADSATHAVFYSISNCQEGLRGISFGNFLIKQVVEELRRELTELREFVTLSPVPGFAGWLAGAPLAQAEEVRTLTSGEGWHEDPAILDKLSQLLPALAAYYFLYARDHRGRVIDPVARFHLGNGASLARINCFGDMSPKAIRNACGLMVNYRYELDKVERNHERYVSGDEVPAAPAICALADRALVKREGGARRRRARLARLS